jgi:hypothetical protein
VAKRDMLYSLHGLHSWMLRSDYAVRQDWMRVTSGPLLMSDLSAQRAEHASHRFFAAKQDNIRTCCLSGSLTAKICAHFGTQEKTGKQQYGVAALSLS